jgi:hypothetical protein
MLTFMRVVFIAPIVRRDYSEVCLRRRQCRMETPSSGGNTTVIERVLKLRRRMGITNQQLSTADPRDAFFFPSRVETSECSMNVPDVQNRLGWLSWPEDAPDPKPKETSAQFNVTIVE